MLVKAGRLDFYLAHCSNSAARQSLIKESLKGEYRTACQSEFPIPTCKIFLRAVRIIGASILLNIKIKKEEVDKHEEN